MPSSCSLWVFTKSSVHCLVSSPSPHMNLKRWTIQSERLFNSDTPPRANLKRWTIWLSAPGPTIVVCQWERITYCWELEILLHQSRKNHLLLRVRDTFAPIRGHNELELGHLFSLASCYPANLPIPEGSKSVPRVLKLGFHPPAWPQNRQMGSGGGFVAAESLQRTNQKMALRVIKI
jgi:hypothetical protein